MRGQCTVGQKSRNNITIYTSKYFYELLDLSRKPDLLRKVIKNIILLYTINILLISM